MDIWKYGNTEMWKHGNMLLYYRKWAEASAKYQIHRQGATPRPPIFLIAREVQSAHGSVTYCP